MTRPRSRPSCSPSSSLIIVGYPVILETLTRGRSLGKFALGLRVVSDDGGPERFRQALMRGLAAVVEIWLVLFFRRPRAHMLAAVGGGQAARRHLRRHVRDPAAAARPAGGGGASRDAAGTGRLGGRPRTVRAERPDGSQARRYLGRLRAHPRRPGRTSASGSPRRSAAQVSPPPPPGDASARLPVRGAGRAAPARAGPADGAGRARRRAHCGAASRDHAGVGSPR